MDRTSRCNKVDAVRFYASYMLNSLLLKGAEVRGSKISSLDDSFGFKYILKIICIMFKKYNFKLICALFIILDGEYL